MRICLLTYRGNPFCGGQGVYVSYLGRELARLGHEVHCVSGPPYPLPTEGMTLHKVDGGLELWLDPVYRNNHNGHPLAALSPLKLFERAAFHAGHFPEMTTFSVRAFAAVRRLMAQRRFDIMHDNQTLGWGLLPLRALGVPLVATIHHPLSIDRMRGFEPPTSFAQQLRRTLFFPMGMQRFVARRIGRLVTVSQVSAQEIARCFGVPPASIRVIHNGLDSDLFRPRPHIARVPGRVLFVGNLQDPNKGGVYLLRAMGRLLARRGAASNAHLLVVSGGIKHWEWLNGHIAAQGLQGRIDFKFKITPEELVDTYAGAEVAVSPSVFEGFGFPAAEAMACGLPLVAARGGALPEVVGDAGVLVPARDSAALADAIGQLLHDPVRRARLGGLGRARGVAHFRWEEAARQMVDFYQETIDAHHRL